MQAVSALPATALQAQPWQGEPDVADIRRTVHAQIYELFQKRRPPTQNQWSSKLPNFVERLEDALFSSAASKEEYANFETLEQRLQEVAKRLVHRSGGGARTPSGGGSASAQLPNGAFDAAAPSMGQPGFGAGPLPATSSMLQPGAFAGAPGPQLGLGMMPTPSSGPPSCGGMVPVKLEGGTPPNGMVPVEAAGTSNGLGQPRGMVPVAGLGSSVVMQPSLMANGAPAVRLKHEGWSPSMANGPSSSSGGLVPSGLPGMMPSPGLVPMGPASSGGAALIPNPGGMVPVSAGAGQQQLAGPGGSMPQVKAEAQLGGRQLSPLAGLAGQPAPSQQLEAALQAQGAGQQSQLDMPVIPAGMMPVSTAGGQQGPRGSDPGSGGLAYLDLPAINQPGAAQQAGSGAGGGEPVLAKSVADRQQYIQKQQRWLLFLRHCAKCQQSEEDCQFSRSCRVGKELWTHILQCGVAACPYPRCTSSKDLLKHHQKCQNPTCPICTPVKEYVRRTRQAPGPSGGAGASVGGAQPSASISSAAPMPDAAQQQQQQQQLAVMQQLQAKRQLAANGMDPAAAAAMPAGGLPAGMMPVPGGPMGMGMVPQQLPGQQQQQHFAQQHLAAQQAHAQAQYALQQQQQWAAQQQVAQQQQWLQQQQWQQVQQQHAYGQMMQPYSQPYQQQQQQLGYAPQQLGGHPGAMGGPGGMPAYANGGGMGHPGHAGALMSAEEQAAKRAKAAEDKRELLKKNTGTSLLECFDLAGIKAHVDLLVAAAAQAKAAQLQPLNPGDECKVCGLTKLTFEPPCIYCTTCGQRIKRGQIYHCTAKEPGCDYRGFWCHSCLSDHKGDRIPWEGSQAGSVRKAELQKKKNDDEIEEAWVQCDCCESWIHQICGLFNRGKNDQNVHYLCPKCLMQGLASNVRERITVRPQAMLEAKDLPANSLSSLLQARLDAKLAEDRRARAAAQGKSEAEVPGAEGLTVRVINNVIKKCEVKAKFHDTFKGDGYPEAFIYRQRVVILFQKMDGVDVALYCMYVQEYGRDCAPPNRNVVYLSYIDSVKYFRPEITTASGISLRTFVYHQILLGYMQHVKGLGFEQMFIWACPPLAGDDYILYCHPSKQKTPRSDRLRAWYHDMLRKAREEGSVAHMSTLWDSYFEGGRDHRVDKPSITHIPYLEGDYWPGEAENLLAQIEAGQRAGGSGGNTALSRKTAGAKGKRYGGSSPQSTDEQLLAKLGEVLGGNMREDFMVVHLQEACSFCRAHVQGRPMFRYLPGAAAGGSQLARPPASERRFEGIRLESPGPSAPAGPLQHLQLCEACHSEEAARVAAGGKSRLPGNLTPSDLTQQMIPPLQLQADRDVDLGSEFFETRQAFLSLCQGNHYQFDSMRRAKHSSMMVLYHLHNPEAPAFSSTCNFCHVEIEPGTGLRCTVCPDFDMCQSCKARGMQHEHPMVATTNFAGRDETRMRLTEQERAERSQQLAKTLALLVHACSCHDPNCNSTSCRKVRQLFQHAVHCTQKVTGGCNLCKKMWCLLNLHAKSCTTSECQVPRCRELKELRRRQTAHIEQKRRLAYSAMMRNSAAAAAASGGGK